MNKMSVKLNTIESAKEFCNVVSDSKYNDVDIDLSCGRYIIDAKSILGILSMDITKKMTVTFHGDGFQRRKEFFDKLNKWKAE